MPLSSYKNYSDISAQTVLGPATVTIGAEQKTLLDLLAEKERLIQILLAASGIKIGTKTEHAVFLAHGNKRRMVINLCLGIYIAQAEDEEFSVVDAV